MAKGGGGAWKVAYADFITAMMALFMVLWILGSEEELLEQLQEYFRNPPSPFDQNSGKFPVEVGEFSGHSSSEAKEAFFERVDPAVLQSMVNEFYRILDMEADADLAPPVEVTVVSDGLRVILFDRRDSPLFEDGRIELTPWGEFLSQNLAWLISRYPFEVVVESHSGERDAAFATEWSSDYGPWEITTDRANELRRRLQYYSNSDLVVRRVSGYGETVPLEGANDRGRTNQRITLSLSLKEHPNEYKVRDSMGEDDVVLGAAMEEAQ